MDTTITNTDNMYNPYVAQLQFRIHFNLHQVRTAEDLRNYFESD